MSKYLIAKIGGKNWLVQESGRKGDTVFGTLDANRAYEPQQVDFPVSQIIAELGTNPPAGTVYGCKIEPYTGTRTHPIWGKVHIFGYAKTDPQVNELGKALNRIGEALRKEKLGSFIVDSNLELEMRQPRGQYGGMYKHRMTKGVYSDRIILMHKGDADVNHILAHESGHGIWYMNLTPQWHAKWVRLYSLFASYTDSSDQALESLKERYFSEGVLISDFMNLLTEEEQVLFQAAIRNVAAYSRLSLQEIDLLADAQQLEVVANGWPHSLKSADFEIAITEYGAKSPKEFFAEAFAFWLNKKMLPKRVQKLVEATLSFVRTQQQ